MPSYLVDTNHLSPIVTIGHPLRARITMQMDMGDKFFIPVVVLTEFLFGIQTVPRSRANRAEWEGLRGSFGYFDIEREEAEQAAEMQTLARFRSRQITTVDALIATIAIRNRLTLLTTDRDFEAILGLQYENWFKT